MVVASVVRSRGEGPSPCPCCGYLTLDERGGYEICPVCYWEDDGQDDHDAADHDGSHDDEQRHAARDKPRCD